MSSNYSVTRDQIILTALRKCGVVEPGDTSATIDPNVISNCAQALNLMVKQWMTYGIKLWTVTEYSLPLTTNKASYVIAPSGGDFTADKPVKLIQAFLRNNAVSPAVDIPMQILSKQEYNWLGSKFSTGTTNSIFMDIGVTSSTVYVFLTPDVITSTNYTLHLVVQRPISDLINSTDVPDFPNEWMQALVWGLADQLALEYGLPMNHRQEITMKAEKYRNDLEDWDTEYASTLFIPDMRMQSRGF